MSMAFELDPRVRKFLDEVLFLPEWDMHAPLEPNRPPESGNKYVIDRLIFKLNDEMDRASSYLGAIGARATKEISEHASGGWPNNLIGGGTWFDQDVQRYGEATRAVYQIRESLIELVAAARKDGILPTVEKVEG